MISTVLNPASARRGRERPARGRRTDARQLLGQFQRKLLFAGAGLLSAMLVSALAVMVAFQVDNFHQGRLDDFARVRLALEQSLGQHDISHTRLANMAEFAWSHQSRSSLLPSEPLRDRYVANGERLEISGDGRSNARLALGLGTADWPPHQLERYLQLGQMLGLIGRLADNDHIGAHSTYFFDPSGRFLSLDPNIGVRSKRHTLDMADRQALFMHLRASADLPTARSSQDQIPALQGVAEMDRPLLSYGMHPFTGEPSLVTVMYVHDGGRPIGVFVSFEPMLHIEGVLRRSSGGRVALVSREGIAVAATNGSQLPPARALGAAAALANDSTRTTVLRRGGHVMLASSVPGTPWALVESYSVRDVLSDVQHLLAGGVLLSLGAILALWMLVLRLKRRWLRPALVQLDRTYANEVLCSSTLDSCPIALCLLRPGHAGALLENTAMRVLASELGSDDACIHERLLTAHDRHAAENTGDDAPLQFLLCLPGNGTTDERHLKAIAVRVPGQETGTVLYALEDMTAATQQEYELQMAREAAEAESRAKSAFLATVSHEIRTPLYGILGHLELLDRPGLEPPQRRRIQRIRQSADSLLDIIRDVLDLSRIEFEPSETEPVAFEPEVLLERVALLFAPLAYAKGVDLDYSIDPAIPVLVCGHEEQIERVLRNLASNAVKFTGSGRVELRVRQVQHEDATGLRFEVADSGIGLSVEQQDRLFRPFSQADDSIRGRFGGSGLGLFLCRQLCASMGGSIEVQSTLGVGTLFTFEVPLQPVAEAAAVAPLAGCAVLLLSPSAIWAAELDRRLLRWGAQVHRLGSDLELGELDAPDSMPLVIFERGESPRSLLGLQGRRKVVRVRVDGPLRPESEGQHWVLSAYAAEALLRILQQGLAPAAVHGGAAMLGLQLPHSARLA